MYIIARLLESPRSSCNKLSMCGYLHSYAFSTFNRNLHRVEMNRWSGIQRSYCLRCYGLFGYEALVALFCTPVCSMMLNVGNGKHLRILALFFVKSLPHSLERFFRDVHLWTSGCPSTGKSCFTSVFFITFPVAFLGISWTIRSKVGIL